MCKYAREIEYSFVTKIYCMIFVRPNATDKTRRIQDRNDSFSDKMSDCASSRVDLARTKYVPRVNVAGPGLLTAQILHVGDSVNLLPCYSLFMTSGSICFRFIIDTLNSYFIFLLATRTRMIYDTFFIITS